MNRETAKEMLKCPHVCSGDITISQSQLLFMSMVFGKDLEKYLPVNMSEDFRNSLLFKTRDRTEAKKREAILKAYAEGKPIEILSNGNSVAVVKGEDADINFDWNSLTFSVLE